VSRVRARVDLAAPVDVVFDFFDDLANASVLVPNLAAITRVSPLPNGGRRVEYVTSGRNGTRHEASSEHVVYDPPRRTVTRSVQSGIAATATRVFTPTAHGTRVDASIEWSVPIRYVARLVSAPLRRPYRRALRDGLDAARAALEGR
jgi:hypothetical protein